MSGYPWITKIPILKYLFGQETKERQQSEIVFAITPHIIRGGEVTDENLKVVDLGSANTVAYHRDNPKVASAASPSTPSVLKPAEKAPSNSPVAKP
jgi:general secretion pathway protein D